MHDLLPQKNEKVIGRELLLYSSTVVPCRNIYHFLFIYFSAWSAKNKIALHRFVWCRFCCSVNKDIRSKGAALTLHLLNVRGNTRDAVQKRPPETRGLLLGFPVLGHERPRQHRLESDLAFVVIKQLSVVTFVITANRQKSTPWSQSTNQTHIVSCYNTCTYHMTSMEAKQVKTKI